MPNVMAALRNVGGAYEERKFCNSLPCPPPQFGWRPLLECCAVKLPIYENARLERKVNFAPGKIPLRGKGPENAYNVYIVYRTKNYAKNCHHKVLYRDSWRSAEPRRPSIFTTSTHFSAKIQKNAIILNCKLPYVECNYKEVNLAQRLTAVSTVTKL